MKPHFYESIQGWFDFQDIYTQVVQEASDGSKFVEVGSWLGRSAAFMAVEIANSGKKIDFYAVDTWRGSAEHTGVVAKNGGSVREIFDSNMERGGVGQIVKPVEAPSVEAAERFADGSLDFVFVDASHDFVNVFADVRAWYPKVKPGGVIAGHDIGWGGLLAAVQQRVPARSIKERVTSWWFRKPASVDDIFEDASGLRVVGDHLLFIPVVNRLDLLQEAVESIPPAVRAVVVDQTNGLGDQIKALLPGHVGYVKTPKRLLFSEVQNAMLHAASLLGVKTLMFMHSDGKCDPTVVEKLVHASSDESDWGVIFTNYDVLCAFNVRGLLDRVGFWDETFEWYASDCDFYRRIVLSGLRIVETGLPVDHRPSSTINSDPSEMVRVNAAADKRVNHYRHKWGGRPGHERNKIPYDGKP
jgi:predicted O-methyltransferase YrrM